MKKSAEFIGLPVISLSEGKEFGKVKELLINSASGTVSALVLELDEEKWYLGAKLLPFEAITGAGEFALIIENSKDILPITAREDFEKFFKDNVKIIGTKVVTKSGKIQGKVTEFFVDSVGKIDACEMENTDKATVSISSRRIITYGKEILFVSDAEGEDGDNINASSNIITPKPFKYPEEKKQELTPDANTNTTSRIFPQAAQDAYKNTLPQINLKASLDALTSNVLDETANTNNGSSSTKRNDIKYYREFLLGKKVNKRLESDKGILIVEENGIITEEVLQKATLANKLIELSMCII